MDSLFSNLLWTSLMHKQDSQVSILELHLNSSSAFSTFKIKSHISVLTLGIKVSILQKVLKNIKHNDDVVTLQCDEPDSVTVRIKRKGSINKVDEFKIFQITIDQETLAIPEKQYPCESLLPTSVLKEVAAELKGFDQMCIRIEPSKIIFSACNESLEAKMEINISQKTGESGYGIVCTEPCEKKFKYAFFNRIKKVTKISEITAVLLALGPDSPLVMTFDLQGTGSLNFYLAPLIEE